VQPRGVAAHRDGHCHDGSIGVAAVARLGCAGRRGERGRAGGVADLAQGSWLEATIGNG
jgi:hypothetical protein